MAIRLMLVDDHAVVRSGLRMLLESQADLEIVGEAGTATEALAALSELHPDVVLMDIGLPDISGIEAAREMRRIRPETAIVALTIHEDEEYFFKMLDAGAVGYVPKRAAPEELVSAIRAAAGGEVFLHPSLAKLLVKDYLGQEFDGQDGSGTGWSDAARAPGPQPAGGRGEQSGDRRAPEDQSEDSRPSPREHHAQTESAFPHRAGQVRHPQGNHPSLAGG